MANNIDDETDSAQAEVEHAAALASVAAAAAETGAVAAAPVAAAPNPASGEEAEPEEVNGNVASDDEPWSMHRRLIRAQLPRTGNEPPPARPLPDFTIRQPGSRAGQRPWGRGGGGEANGNTPNANRHGRGGGQGQGGGQSRPAGVRGARFAGSQPRPDGGRRGGPGQGGGGGGRPGGGGGRGRRSR